MTFYLQATINCLFLRVGHAPPTHTVIVYTACATDGIMKVETSFSGTQ